MDKRDGVTTLERIERIEEELVALLQYPGDVVKIKEILRNVRELKEQERLLSEIF